MADNMINDPFAALLLPDEEIVWTAESAPARSWLNGLALIGAAVGLLVFCGPIFWLAVVACYDFGGIYPLQLMSSGYFLRNIVPILLVPFILWKAIGLLRDDNRVIYGLSKLRAFTAAADPSKRWVSASFVLIGGTVEIVEVPEHFSFRIPIQHDGNDAAFVQFGRISKSQFETALSLVNTIIGSPAK